VFLEDSAGLVGVALAFLGIFLGQLFHNPAFDPIASILIAVVLSAVAILLGRESGALLVGERTNLGKLRGVREIIERDPAVEGVGDLLSMQLGPEQVLLTANIRFRRGLDVQELEATIARLEERIKKEEPTIERICIEADSLRQQPQKASEAAGPGSSLNRGWGRDTGAGSYLSALISSTRALICSGVNFSLKGGILGVVLSLPSSICLVSSAALLPAFSFIGGVFIFSRPSGAAP
jgi:hypothetical protein